MCNSLSSTYKKLAEKVLDLFMENSNQTFQTQRPVNPTPNRIDSSSGPKVIPIVLGIAVVIIVVIGAYLLGTK